MAEELKMPERQPGDGAIRVERLPDDRILFAHEGENGGHLIVSEHNAWRLIGAASLILGLPLTKSAAKAIKF